jgi:uncharacterized repeat protein (TIGR03803 family)
MKIRCDSVGMCFSYRAARCFALITLLVIGVQTIRAQTESVLYSFSGGADGGTPVAGLVRDPQGNLFGTTYYGGLGYGTVFRLAPSGKERVLHAFTSAEGDFPSAPLIQDPSGTLYGTTLSSVFKLTPKGAERVLHTFGFGFDGSQPMASLVRDDNGNLYGTTKYGGTNGFGTVFAVSAKGKEKILYNFTGAADGSYPMSNLIRDAAGTLYGTTSAGGASPIGYGTVFKVSGNTETVLYKFGNFGKNGSFPFAGLIEDAVGNFYGTTWSGGNGAGTVFQLTPEGVETVLYAFVIGIDAANPNAGLIRDAEGNLYGTTWHGGAYGFGAVYKVAFDGSEEVLYSFTGGTDGAYPLGGLVQDSQGNFYGTTENGGTYDKGVVFKIVP